MKRLDARLKDVLQEVGAVFLRHGRHYVYGLPNGRIITVPCSPSDRRALANLIHDIRLRASLPRQERTAA